MSQESQQVSEKGNTKPSRIRARRYCFTLNNYTDEECLTVSQNFEKEKYFIFGKEVGENGTPHLQGYVEFNNQKDLTTLKKINPRIHWEKAKGSKEQNIKYCKKDGDITKKDVESYSDMVNRLIKKNQEELILKYKEKGFDIDMITYMCRIDNNNINIDVMDEFKLRFD